MDPLFALRAFVQKTWWIFCGMLLLGLAAFGYTRHVNEAAFDSLYRAELSGKIRSLGRQNHGFSVAVGLENGGQYRFFPTKQQGGAAGFVAKATVGDSLQKPHDSDTLVLITQGQKVRYAFKKVLY